MKQLLFAFLIIINIQAFGQFERSKSVFWFIPSVDTQINGIASGLIINSMKDTDSLITTEINGLGVELIGVGLFLPLAPSSPIYNIDRNFIYTSERSIQL